MRRTILKFLPSMPCLLTGLGVWLLLTWLCVQGSTLAQLELTPDDRLTPGTYPLVSTGHTGEADLVYLRYLGDNKAVVGLDAWGWGGAQSEPFELTPGRSLSLGLIAPFLGTGQGTPVVVLVNGRVVLDKPLGCRTGPESPLQFGENIQGFSLCSERLHGRLSARGEPPTRANLHSGSLIDRLRLTLLLHRGRLLASLLLGALAASLCAGLARIALPLGELLGGCTRGARISLLVTILLCSLCFHWFVRHGEPLLGPEPFTSFNDAQAVSLLDGRLDVPGASLSGEAFLHDGKVYGYFGVTPALLRLPLVVAGVSTENLARFFLWAEHLLALLVVTVLFLQVHRLVHGDARPPSAFVGGLVLLNAGLGSTLFFLGSRGYVYHEAIMSGTLFSLAACAFCLHGYSRPEGRWWLGALGCGLLAVHGRPSGGLFPLTLIGVLAAWLILRRWPSLGGPFPARLTRLLGASVRELLIGSAAVLAVLSFNGLSYLKFGTIEGCPLRMNANYNQKRLEKINYRQFHLENIPYNFNAYFLGTNTVLGPKFPFLSYNPEVAAPFRSGKMDMVEKHLCYPVSMPGLFFPALLGGAILLVTRNRIRPFVALLALAALPATLAMLAAIAVSQRYTADFLPYFLLFTMLGLCACQGLRPVLRRPLLGLSALLAALAIVMQGAIALDFQGTGAWDTPPGARARHQECLRLIQECTGLDQGLPPAARQASGPVVSNKQ